MFKRKEAKTEQLDQALLTRHREDLGKFITQCLSTYGTFTSQQYHTEYEAKVKEEFGESPMYINHSIIKVKEMPDNLKPFFKDINSNLKHEPKEQKEITGSIKVLGQYFFQDLKNLQKISKEMQAMKQENPDIMGKLQTAIASTERLMQHCDKEAYDKYVKEYKGSQRRLSR